jgi:signal transduction histidine kinase/DNA-binding response OmpR family regulator
LILVVDEFIICNITLVFMLDYSELLPLLRKPLYIVWVGFIFLVGCQSKDEASQLKEDLIVANEKTASHFYYDETELKWKRIITDNVKRDSLVKKVLDLNNQGTDFRDNAQFKDALTNHFEAFQLAEEINDTLGQILALNNIGTDLRRTSSNLEASEYHYKALELANRNELYAKNKAIAMNGLGNIFLALKKPIEAQNYFERSLEIEKKLKSNLGQAINYANLGEVMRMKGDVVRAIQLYNYSLQQNEIIQSNIGIAICKKAIGSILYEQGQKDRAKLLMREAIDIIKETQDAFHDMEIQMALCEVLIADRQLEEAQLILTNILKNARAINSFEHLKISYELQSDISRKKQDFQQALHSKEMAIVYRDSMLVQNNEVRILELENRYKNKEAIQQIKLLESEKKMFEKNKINQNRIFLLIFLLLLTLSGFMYFRYLQRRKVSLELKKINEMKSRFYSNVSHEFRTPLTLIKGPLEKLLQREIDVSIRSEAEMMYRNTQRLQYLVDQILSLSKIDAGKFQIKAQEANLSDDINGISHSFNYQTIERNLQYLVDIEESGLVYFDVEIIEIILTNLLSNAFKFTLQNGQIKMTGTSLEKHYQIKISNTTDVVVKNELTKIFDRFYSSAQSHHTGTGIGLSLVKELCVLYRIDLKVKYNEPDELEFNLMIPIQKEHFKASEIVAIKTDVVNQKETSELEPSKMINEFNRASDQPIVLVVEDNEDMRKYIVSCFSNDYQILEAKDGKEGVDLALQFIPDIVLSDVMMPHMNGIELCNTLKNEGNTYHIPIVLLTALSDEEHILEGLQNQADDYITKPFGVKILQTKVRNLIELRRNLSNKYKEEIEVKPLNWLLKSGENSFQTVLKDVFENQLINPDFGVEEFCKAAAMSRTQLHRKLTALTGMSVTEFIRVHRLKIASELLQNPDLNISEVCYASGFSDPSYFSKQFKLIYGISPIQYKEKNAAQ